MAPFDRPCTTFYWSAIVNIALSQLYLRCQRQHMTKAGQRLEMCITDVSHWMAANRLKLNADKTELLWAGSKYGSTLLGSSGPPLRLGDETHGQ